MDFLNKERNTLKESIPLMSLLSALSIIISVIISYFPMSMIVLSLILPIPSIIVTLYIKPKYYPIYAITTLLITLIFNVYDVSFILLSLIPTLIGAFILGISIKNKLNFKTSIALTSLIMTLINLLIILFFYKIYNVDLLNIVFKMLFNEAIYFYHPNSLIIIFTYTFIENLIMYFVNFKYFKMYINKISEDISNILDISLLFLLFILNLLFFFYLNEYYYFLIYIICVLSLILGINENKLIKSIVINLSSLILTWLIYILFNKYFSIFNSFILLSIYPTFIIIYKSLNLFPLLKKC